MPYKLNPFTGQFDYYQTATGFLTKSQADTYYYPLSTNPAGYLTSATNLWTRIGTILSPTTAEDDVSISGKVGIGITPSTYKLDVYGSAIRIGGAGTTEATHPGFIFVRDDTTNQTHFQEYFEGNSYLSQNFRREHSTGYWYQDKATDYSAGMAFGTDTVYGQGTVQFFAVPPNMPADSIMETYTKMAVTTTGVFMGDKAGIYPPFFVPSAKLHLGAGTATAGTASLKINAGTLLTNKEAGAIESDGTHIYWSKDTSNRYQLDQQGGGGGYDLTGTTNQITLSASGVGVLSTRNIQLSLPQDIGTASSVTFANVTDSGLTTGRIVYTGASGILASSANLLFDNVLLTCLRPIKYTNSFTFTLDANASTDAVTFPTAFGVGVVPVVVCTPEYQTSFWVTSITNTGFTFNVGTTNGYAQLINCIAMAPV